MAMEKDYGATSEVTAKSGRSTFKFDDGAGSVGESEDERESR